jgi:hypothetical protein
MDKMFLIAPRCTGGGQHAHMDAPRPQAPAQARALLVRCVLSFPDMMQTHTQQATLLYLPLFAPGCRKLLPDLVRCRQGSQFGYGFKNWWPPVSMKTVKAVNISQDLVQNLIFKFEIDGYWYDQFFGRY